MDPLSIAQIKKDITTTCNNPQKIMPVLPLTPIQIEYNSKQLLVLKVPVSSQVHKLKGIIYDRENDSDIKITDPHKISEIYFKVINQGATGIKKQIDSYR